LNIPISNRAPKIRRVLFADLDPLSAALAYIFDSFSDKGRQGHEAGIHERALVYNHGHYFAHAKCSKTIDKIAFSHFFFQDNGKKKLQVCCGYSAPEMDRCEP